MSGAVNLLPLYTWHGQGKFTFIYPFITHLKASKESELMAEFEMSTFVEKIRVQIADGETRTI